MFLVLLGLTNLVQASVAGHQQHTTARHFDHELSENPVAEILGVRVNGELIKLPTEKDVDEFFKDQDAYIKKIKQLKAE